MNLEQLRKECDKLLSERNQLIGQLKSERQALAHARERLMRSEDAQKVIQTVAKNVQQKAHEGIAKIVTKALRVIFDEPMRFELVFEKKRGRTEARPTFFKGKHEVHPTDGSGGGVLDVAVLGLRVASILLAEPELRRFLAMDEPFRNLSSPIYRDRIRQLIELLAEELNFQFLLVTQTPELEFGKVYRFRPNNRIRSYKRPVV